MVIFIATVSFSTSLAWLHTFAKITNPVASPASTTFAGAFIDGLVDFARVFIVAVSMCIEIATFGQLKGENLIRFMGL